MAQCLFMCGIECNPIRHSLVEPTRGEYSVFDPAVDHTGADSKLSGYLLDGQLLGLLEYCRRDLITPADPLDNLRGIRLTFGAAVTLSIELLNNLQIEQSLGYFADSLHHDGWVALRDRRQQSYCLPLGSGLSPVIGIMTRRS